MIIIGHFSCSSHSMRLNLQQKYMKKMSKKMRLEVASTFTKYIKMYVYIQKEEHVEGNKIVVINIT